MRKPQTVPDPKRPLMMIRLRFGHEEPEIWRRTFEQLKQNRECCDEVWFSTGIGIPVMEEHRRLSELIASHAEDLRKIGIIPSLQIQATIGHGDSLTESAGAEGKTWGSFVGLHGEKCKYCNCPRQPDFLAYLKEMSEIYAVWKPGSVWIDDDLRLFGHYPASGGYGCCCPHCLSLFSQQEGREYTREEIEAGCAEETPLKKRWYEFSRQSLCGIAETIVRGFHKFSPETAFGLQHNSDFARIPVFDTLLKTSGIRPGSRPGGGSYSDHEPYQILDKAYFTSMQISEQPGYETLSQICPEIESCPRDFCCKTPQGLRIESLLDLAIGTDSLSYFIMDPLYETPEWYGEELLKPLAADTPCFREFIRYNQGTQPGGLGLPLKTYALAEQQGLPLVGIPSAACSPYANCLIVSKNTIENLSDDELDDVLRKDILLDGAAVLEIQARKMEDRIGGIRAERLQKSVFDFYTDEPFNKGLTAPKHYPFSEERYVFESASTGKTTILSRYLDHTGKDYGIATLLLERPDGTRVACIGNDGFNTRYISSTRVRFLSRITDWVSHDSLPALPMDPVQCLLIPRVTGEGELRSLMILNTTINRQKPFTVELRNIPDGISHAEWLVPSEKPVLLEIKRDGRICTITLPEIAPWGIGWVKI